MVGILHKADGIVKPGLDSKEALALFGQFDGFSRSPRLEAGEAGGKAAVVGDPELEPQPLVGDPTSSPSKEILLKKRFSRCTGLVL